LYATPACRARRLRRRRVILRRIDVARRPADVGAERLQRLDQHGGLDRHVQAAGDPCAAQRLRWRELVANRHQSRHFRLGDRDLLATPIGKRQIGDFVICELPRFVHCIHQSLR
jgi:hypothetical protein